MRTLALSGGDLVLGAGGLQLISGPAKIRQDVALALGESYGTDPYHPEWGSVLPEYIGQPVDSEIRLLIKAEVNRILQQYMATQQAMLASASTSNRATALTTEDVVRTVDEIQVSGTYDVIRVRISLTTMAGQTLNLNRTVTS